MSQSNIALPSSLQQTLRDLSSLANALDEFSGGWQLIKIENETRIWWNAGMKSFKCSRFIRCNNLSIENLVKLLTIGVKDRKKWDPGCCEARIISSTENLSCLYLSYLSYSWWIWPRDYCILQYVQKEKNGVILIPQQSTVNPSTPPKSIWEGVRGEFSFGGFIIKPTESPNCVQLTFVCSLFMKGFLNLVPLQWITPIYFTHFNCLSGIQLLLEEVYGLPSISRSKLNTLNLVQSQVNVDNSVQTKETSLFSLNNTSTGNSNLILMQEQEEKENEEELSDDDYFKLLVEGINYPPQVPPHYAQAMDTAMKILLKYSEEDDWTPVSVINDVEIHKKSFPGTNINCARGKGQINVPPIAITKLFEDIPNRSEWEPMFDKNEIIEDYGQNMYVMRMMYKAKWPTTARDFCNLTFGTTLNDGRSIVVATSVDHEKCPPAKNYVRAHCVVGGYLLTPLKDDPMKCTVVYITQVDLKGSLPTSIMNQVSTEQPLNIDNIRKVITKKNLEEYRSLASEYKPIPKIRKKMKLPIKSQVQNPQLQTSQHSQQTQIENQVQVLQQSQVQNSELQTSQQAQLRTSSANDNILFDKQISSDKLLLSSSQDFSDQLPLDSSRTVPIESDNLNPTSSPRFNDFVDQGFASLLPQFDSDEWKYVSTKNGIVIHKKEPKNGFLYSFKGFGEIQASPTDIKNLIIDVHRAQEWDSLFNKGSIVETVNANTRIVHLMYQTKMCILKAARDFCIVQSWKQTDNDTVYILGKSVQYPSCVSPKGYIRGEILESGYFIKTKSPTSSEVTFIVQVDLKGMPTGFLNVIGERQPLVIAGLKKVLEKKDSFQ